MLLRSLGRLALRLGQGVRSGFVVELDRIAGKSHVAERQGLLEAVIHAADRGPARIVAVVELVVDAGERHR